MLQRRRIRLRTHDNPHERGDRRLRTVRHAFPTESSKRREYPIRNQCVMRPRIGLAIVACELIIERFHPAEPLCRSPPHPPTHPNRLPPTPPPARATRCNSPPRPADRHRRRPCGTGGLVLLLMKAIDESHPPAVLAVNLSFCAMMMGVGILFYVRGTIGTGAAAVAIRPRNRHRFRRPTHLRQTDPRLSPRIRGSRTRKRRCHRQRRAQLRNKTQRNLPRRFRRPPGRKMDHAHHSALPLRRHANRRTNRNVAPGQVSH